MTYPPTISRTGRVTTLQVQRALADIVEVLGDAPQGTAASVQARIADAESAVGPVAAADITDATAAGIALLTAANAGAQRTAMGVPATSHTHVADDISDATTIGKTVAKAADAAAVRTAISAANSTHTHAQSDITNLTSDLAAKADLPLTARLTADVGPNSTIHTTSMADVTGAALSLAANTTYMVEMVVVFTSSASTEGLVLGLTFPAVTYVGFEVIIPNADNGTGQGFHGQIIASAGKVIGTGRPNATPATGPWVATIRGVIRPSAAGTLQLTYGAETAAGGASVTIKAGTVLRAGVVA